MATIREKSPGQWHVQIRRKGWPQQTATFKTKKKAQAWARQIESDMDKGLFVDRSTGHRTTLKELIELYLKHVNSKRPSQNSRTAERYRLQRFMREETHLCAHATIHLTPEHFDDYRDRRLAQTKPGGNGTLSPGTVKRELTLLKRVIDYRKRQLGLLINPVNTDDVARPVVNDERDVRLTDEELERLLQECGRSRNLWLLPIVEFAFETGARRASLLRLKWDDVDLENRTAIFRGVKNSRNPNQIIDHTVGLSLRATEVLKSIPRSLDGRVFPITASALRQAFERARKRARVEHFRLHDARHERVSNLFEAGWSDMEVMTLSGHKDPKSLKRYANLKTDHMISKLDKIKKSKSPGG